MVSPSTGYFPDNYQPVLSPSLSSSLSVATSSSFCDEDDKAFINSTSSDKPSQGAQEEWEENIRQLQLALSVLILPTLGKYLGRRWAYSLYKRYIAVGWSWTLFLPKRWPIYS
ncbi:MAG: hypothetical protein CYPHOPRED_003442 [Cyphobasidiales sp. Tagirdzhanova-0007]|nr:MAG: hypothetical protein CYPHOPRED_003442 [Cyphobasidiales sp. Tagirdzhanova-0007]